MGDIGFENQTSYKGKPAISIQESPSTQSTEQSQHRSGARAKLFLLVSGALFIIFLAIALVFRGTSPDAKKLSAKREVAIQLEVLNGSTESKAAQRLTEALRAGGFDVVDMGNYRTSDVEHTTIIGRTVDQSAAFTVASYLGVEKSRVLQQPDRTLYLDVSVIIGKDINRLRVFK